MRRNLQDYNEYYSKKTKSSFWSLAFILVGFTFTILAITNPKAKLTNEVNQEIQKQESVQQKELNKTNFAEIKGN